MNHKLPLNKIKTSIVIRCKNESRQLEELLNVLFEQTEMGFELIIVDNNSTDGTFKMLKRFPVATLIHIPDKEFNHALSCNLGMYAARKNLVVLTNGHCLPISKTWLSDGLLNFKDKTIAGVDGNYRTRRDGSKWERLGDIWQADTLNLQRKDQSLTTTNAIIRRDLWKKYPFDESLPECEDYDWSKEMLARKFRTLKEPKFNVYHSHNLTQKQREAQSAKWEKICSKINKRSRPKSCCSKIFSKDFWKKTKIVIEELL